jgi:hypothetical protein
MDIGARICPEHEGGKPAAEESGRKSEQCGKRHEAPCLMTSRLAIGSSASSDIALQTFFLPL